MWSAPYRAIFYQNTQLFERCAHDLEPVFLILQERMEDQSQASAISDGALQRRANHLPEANRGQRFARSREGLPKTAEARQVVVGADGSAAVLRELGQGFDEGALRAPAIAERYPLEQAGEVYARGWGAVRWPVGCCTSWTERTLSENRAKEELSLHQRSGLGQAWL